MHIIDFYSTEYLRVIRIGFEHVEERNLLQRRGEGERENEEGGGRERKIDMEGVTN